MIGFSGVANLVISAYLARTAKATGSAALEADAAHLRTDAWTSFGVLAGLVAVQVTGEDWIDPTIALLVAVAIVRAGVRLVTRSGRDLWTRRCPRTTWRPSRRPWWPWARAASSATTSCARAGPGRSATSTSTSSSGPGTTLEEAHEIAHDLQDHIRSELRGADVLIHLEPADRVRPGTEITAG